MTFVEGIKETALETGYRVGHTGLAVALGGALQLAYRALAPGVVIPFDRARATALLDKIRGLLAADLDHVRRGYYPAELLTQLPIMGYLMRAPESLLDMPSIVARFKDNRFQELPDDVDLSRYPSYYKRNFHWQTDGWFSSKSARLYDLEVEILFGGTADIMRRMAIPPVVDAVRGFEEQPRVLDVACGTGRFLRQLHAALPKARLYGVDLSPFYVKEATRVLADVPEVSLIVDDAERLPFADGAFDVVTSVFLFHELPRAVRRTVIAEMRRVLAPGGTMVLLDSAQLSDSPELGPYLSRFADLYHEPFHAEYLRDPLEKVVEAAGFEAVRCVPFSVSKRVVGKKPA